MVLTGPLVVTLKQATLLVTAPDALLTFTL
jgi:hypothetical protein